MTSISPELSAEILACLQRSGYLLESRLVHLLSTAKFFVEPNVAVLDPRTGKSREIDMLAEFYEHNPHLERISVRTVFAVEAINNSFPLILMTEHPASPITDIDAFVRYGITPANAPFQTRVDVYEGKGIFNISRYTQYCGLTRKKQGDELMASHPDDLYSSFLKLADFIEHQTEDFESREWPNDDDYWRLWFWQPILVVGGDLLAVQEDAGNISLVEIDEGPLVFNYHAAEQPRTIIIQVVRERQLVGYAQRLVAEDSRLAEKLQDMRSTELGASPNSGHGSLGGQV